jgi:hypothetical protein
VFDTIKNEKSLEVDRLLAPERPIIVERCDPLSYRHEIRRAFLGHLFHESLDGLLGAVSFQEGNGSEVCAQLDVGRASIRKALKT